ncbi:malto-oligosyltrehalose synthase [Spirosoma foliorum]|uniref:Malto-oligosyltrehalose synthase n=1 Tax=Spirosoma foliorum TaxID=2710596 RepID=A0A7G5GYL8_9BACT|nr:malto-oligosyltrehalose synthase [Spirosoma foliorum]QMW03960.1 malto-oligosyltrehalose synthase [Spirosoma foliorum]
MINPISTYRVQFHKNFTFHDFERLIPYLNKLGIRTVYASPIFEAVPGSMHGYDAVNPDRINPEIGTEEQLKAISRQLQELGINWIQDIVPNHMALHPDNAWLMDVLEKGQRSVYASFFDIDWTSSVYEGRLMVPLLGANLAECISRGELSVAYQDKRFVLTYQDAIYPINLRSYKIILQADTDRVDESIQGLIQQFDKLDTIIEPEMYASFCAELQENLADLLKKPTVDDYLKSGLKAVNTNPALICQIADDQAYRLCYSGETEYQINYRRFFTVNNMICLNIQELVVFEHVHRYTKKLLESGLFQGLRIDHIDGLYDPSQYLDRLRELAGPNAYIVVEKILEQGEELLPYWPIQGATGYQYLSLLNNLLTQTRSQQAFTQFYRQLLGEKKHLHLELHDKKASILHEHMGGELTNLHQLLLDLNLIDTDQLKVVQPETLKAAIGEFLIWCPVYRYFGNDMPLDNQEAKAIRAILDQIRSRKPELISALDLLDDVLLIKPLTSEPDYNNRALHFYQRCMQFTGPLMAKGVEDTLMYTYNRFIGHDEVGDSPEFFGLAIADFHQKMCERQASWPLALSATSTHDTKRGEDVRSRLNVLTDLADEWIEEVNQWLRLNQPLDAPDRNDEYFIYQTLVGAYPMPGVDSANEQVDFADRLTEYLQKALREAKRYSSHADPNEVYEETTKTFAQTLLDQKRPFWTRFQAFHQRVADFGIINSLVQVVLKCTCPGIPDVYQGCELWDLSLVDPDNRRPVDFEQRQRWLDELILLEANDDLWPELWQNRYDARIKLWLLHRLLTERNQQPELFANGGYKPLLVEGFYKENVLAFARLYQQLWYVVVIPLGLASVCREQQVDAVSLDWKDTRLVLPADAPVHWENRLNKDKGKCQGGGIAIKELFTFLPLAVLKVDH